MLIHSSCEAAIQACLDTKTFAIAHLYNGEKTMGIHIHDCYEVYFSISGGKQFLIDDRVYQFQPGDIFFINQFESHYLSEVDLLNHERIVLSIYPEYLKRFSTPQTDLNYCFTQRHTPFGHRISLSEDEQKRFMYFIHKLSEGREFGQDVLDQSVFTGLAVFLNRAFKERCTQTTVAASHRKGPSMGTRRAQIDDILSYINSHLATDLSIAALASHFYLSKSHLCQVFKDSTGTTINQYVTAKRIALAKALLADGHTVAETSSLCGFRDYSNFLKSFSRIVGVSPKKYATYTRG